jgi:hypothetical protein
MKDDACVSVRASQDRAVGHVRKGHVVDELGLARHQRGVLDAVHLFADVA